MRRAEGFITGDGTFFESMEQAELHEAEMRLRHGLGNTFPDLSQDKFFVIMVTMLEEIGGYINAHQAAHKRDTPESEVGDEIDDGIQAAIDDGLGHVSSTEKDLTSLLKLPTRRPEHVPDVGSGTQSKKIPDGRKKHGAGVRERDA